MVQYTDGEKRYIIAPNGLKVGQEIASGAGVAPEVGNTLLLSEIPLGTLVHNIELRPGQGAAMARSAGTYAQLAAREGNHAILRLPSGETRMVLVTCRATVGTVSNPDHSLESHGKAGRKRWLGRRPRNRGVVMNPVDHPSEVKGILNISPSISSISREPICCSILPTQRKSNPLEMAWKLMIARPAA